MLNDVLVVEDASVRFDNCRLKPNDPSLLQITVIPCDAAPPTYYLVTLDLPTGVADELFDHRFGLFLIGYARLLLRLGFRLLGLPYVIFTIK